MIGLNKQAVAEEAERGFWWRVLGLPEMRPDNGLSQDRMIATAMADPIANARAQRRIVALAQQLPPFPMRGIPAAEQDRHQ